jgi:predicted DNA-binding transcriptional regulator AlpA
MARPKRRAERSSARHLTIAEVCAELDISRSTFYDWRAKRKAPPCLRLPNGDLRVRRTDFDNWLASLDEETV